MEFASSLVAAIVALLGVALGGWLSSRDRHQSWRLDQIRHWQDVRLTAYSEFFSAYSQYVTFILQPDTRITASPHPRYADEWMPFFDETGRPYKDRFEASCTAIRLISKSADTRRVGMQVAAAARRLAAARATHETEEIPMRYFEDLASAESAFFVAVRTELGIPEASDTSTDA